MNWLDKYREWLSKITPKILLMAVPAIAAAYGTFGALYAWRNPGCDWSTYWARVFHRPGRCSGTAEVRAFLYWVIAFGVGGLVCVSTHYLAVTLPWKRAQRRAQRGNRKDRPNP
jgi:hypothetical protein